MEKVEKNEDTLVLKEPGYMGQHYYGNFLNDTLREGKLNKAMIEGDSISYFSVMADYSIGGNYNEFLYYDLMMAERHQNRQAYLEVFGILNDTQYGSLSSESNLYKKNADYYLIKSWIKGALGADNYMSIRFGKGIDSLRVMKYLDKLEQHLIHEKIAY